MASLSRFGLCLDPSLSSGTYHEDVDTFDLPPLLPAEFSVDHVEVWGLGPETDADTERAKLHIRKPNLNVRSGEVDMDDLASQLM
jgi:hypothetical protein